MATYLEQSLKALEGFEGAIPWMYRDTVGKVTVGVGMMLPDSSAACRLPFAVGSRPATEAEVIADFNRVEALPMGRASLFYRKEGGLVLGKDDIDSLFRTVLLGFEDHLRQRLAGYDTLPDSVKMALLDMAYNLGPQGLLSGYPKMVKAVEAGDWAQAAACCFRHGPSEARNDWTKKMFLQNVVGALQAEGESILKDVFYGLLGAGAAFWNFVRRSRSER